MENFDFNKWVRENKESNINEMANWFHFSDEDKEQLNPNNYTGRKRDVAQFIKNMDGNYVNQQQVATGLGVNNAPAINPVFKSIVGDKESIKQSEYDQIVGGSNPQPRVNRVKNNPPQNQEVDDDKLEPINNLPRVEVGQNITINNIPFVGNLVFTPVIINWKGIIPNPLFIRNAKTNTVKYYLDKDSTGRQSDHKITKELNNFFRKHPNENTDENKKLTLAQFLIKMKNQGNNDYKMLLHDHGDETDYISFKADNLTKEKGLYMWVVDNQPEYIGIAASGDGLSNRINNEYGAVTAYKCTVDGQSQTCRSNSKLRDEYRAKKNISLYVAPIDTKQLLNNPDFVKAMGEMGFKGTRVDKNVLEVIEKYIIKSKNFKTKGWNRRT